MEFGFDPDSPFGRMTVRVIVASADGRRFTFDSTRRAAFEGTYGAAPIDGIPGAEIALSWLRGAHASSIEVLTFRGDALVKEKGWVRDFAYTYGVGVEWIPGTTDLTPVMRRCSYSDVSIGGRPGYRTTTVDFTWLENSWVAGAATYADYRFIDRVPWQCSRFRVPGMSRMPMILFHAPRTAR